ncbi:unnamed protein product [Danaus chrysippus]|uniref:(African queen) hypothetical protein n=1 Tax=Danaus chrysippus TaxID=151541 RepID=A0A8J2MVH9_9NEOP|nr:unnamed protein product [Danaus chrysippus]CAG9557888.1 unnamed protein product [Danaus chrysippus]CAG9566096.1 unnamed protein product [Danaus chrysippus]
MERHYTTLTLHCSLCTRTTRHVEQVQATWPGERTCVHNPLNSESGRARHNPLTRRVDVLGNSPLTRGADAAQGARSAAGQRPNAESARTVLRRGGRRVAVQRDAAKGTEVVRDSESL